ncbi:uncharacterized protein LOC128201631 [Galleria mellonella]|uniref:Uncharacterized protein LOC128201631 n=1 Tax=Galleria mellonella TaxID=7137 RepID=A0ABM3MUX2_GALME|nr:uncharacterized protein LOC128201631 [Galleria mellonella]
MTVAGRVRIGWVSAKAELLRQRPLRCFRCLEEGHVRASCSHEQDRSGLCYRCGNEGHKAAMCAADPKCAVCSAQGRPSDHWVGSKACTPPKKRKKQPVKLPNPAGRGRGDDCGGSPTPHQHGPGKSRAHPRARPLDGGGYSTSRTRPKLSRGPRAGAGQRRWGSRWTTQGNPGPQH